MARLHGKGLAYSDPSPANIFISKDPDYNEVWFIDTDNLCYESTIKTGGGVYTRRYGAPELVRGEAGVSTLTDVHAFAVIAFQALTLVHPLIGDYVNDGEPELEEQALAGHVSWVEDEGDDINYANFGIPRDWVLSKKLWDMFSKAFGGGRVDPLARPGAAEWAERLSNAADATIICPECGGTYYFNSEMCTWCNADRPAVLKAKFCLWEAVSTNKGQIVTKPQNGKKKPVFVDQLTMSEGETVNITRRIAFNDQGKSAYEPVMALKFQANRLHLSSLDGQEYRLLSVHDKNETTITAKQKAISGKSGTLPWLLHLGPLDKSHRVLIFQIEPREL
jgi:DNA-binding helix-hairpin-helix protein with protein kinase domain